MEWVEQVVVGMGWAGVRQDPWEGGHVAWACGMGMWRCRQQILLFD